MCLLGVRALLIPKFYFCVTPKVTDYYCSSASINDSPNKKSSRCQFLLNTVTSLCASLDLRLPWPLRTLTCSSEILDTVMASFYLDNRKSSMATTKHHHRLLVVGCSSNLTKPKILHNIKVGFYLQVNVFNLRSQYLL